jgi:hypothetical protein
MDSEHIAIAFPNAIPANGTMNCGSSGIALENANTIIDVVEPSRMDGVVT